MNQIIVYKDGQKTSEYDNAIEANFRGDNALIEIFNPKRINKISIEAGDNVHITIMDGCVIYDYINFRVPAPGTNIYIGKCADIGQLNIFSFDEHDLNLRIGDNCLFGWPVIIRLCDSHTIYDITTNQILNIPHGISIGNHVWLGENVVCLKRTKIADNSVIAMKSLVTKEFNEPNVIIAGIPGKIIKRNINWDILPTNLVNLPQFPPPSIHTNYPNINKNKSLYAKFINFLKLIKILR